MSAYSLQVTYRKGTPFAAYIYLAHAPGTKSARSEQVGPELVIDYAADGSPLGIEVVSPGFVTSDEINEVFERLGLEPPPASDLAPLRAAWDAWSPRDGLPQTLLRMIPLSSLTRAQCAAISNTICGDADSARELEAMGLLRITSIKPGSRGLLAFFDLTPSGDEFVETHFVIRMDEGAVTDWSRSIMQGVT
jgi:hypothetical protein